MLVAHGRKVVFTDSDLPYSLKNLSAVVAALDQTDVAVGTRTGAHGGRRADPGSARQMSSKSFSAMVSRWFGLPTADTQCGLKGFTRAAARAVFGRARVNGFSFDVEALAIARARGLRVRTVPGGASAEPAFIRAAHPPFDANAGGADRDPAQSHSAAIPLAGSRTFGARRRLPSECQSFFERRESGESSWVSSFA